MKPLPWPNGDRIVELKETRGGHPPRFGGFSNTAYLAWHEDARTLDEIAAWSQQVVTLAGPGEPERVRVTTNSASLFRTIGVTPLIGTLFDATAESSRVVVLSERLWRDRFGADPSVPGRVIQLDREPYTIVGVLRDVQAFPDRQSLAWIPLRVRPSVGNSLSMFNAIARLKPGATPAQAASEGAARGQLATDTGMTTMAIFGSNGPIEIAATPLGDAITSDVRRPLIVLLAAVGLLFLTATANVASLQLARATTRRRELAIRVAIGAASLRITRQLLVENLMLGAAGGALGVAIAWAIGRALPTLLPPDFPRADGLGLDPIVLIFAVMLSIAASVAFGVAPAIHAHRANLVESLSDGVAAVGAGRRSRTAAARAAIMTGQVAIACMLLVAAALLGRSFVELLEADRGYDATGVVATRISLPSSLYSPEQRYTLIDRLLERSAAIPALREIGMTTEIITSPGGSTSGFTFVSPIDGTTIQVQSSPRIVNPKSFRTLGFHVVAGRVFTEADTDTAPPVVVVNETFARRYLGDNPLKAALPPGAGYGMRRSEIAVIGVIRDMRYPATATTTLPELFFSYLQMDRKLVTPAATLLVKTDDQSSAAAALRTAIREADPNLVIEPIVPLEERILATLARPRMYAALLAAFALFAATVAGVGLFGVLSYTVSQRSKELALRNALGAGPARIRSLVMKQAAVITAVGVTLGLAGSAALMRSASALLFGISAFDGVTYAGAAAGLVVVAAVAAFVPARRASRLDPSTLLR
jgi:predicted permease